MKISGFKKGLEDLRREAVDHLGLPVYSQRRILWLQTRFPNAVYTGVEGLVKLVDRGDIEANDWSLTPGRYVGVAPEEEDEDFDFKKAIREIHMEVVELNAEAVQLADEIKRNFEELGL